MPLQGPRRRVRTLRKPRSGTLDADPRPQGRGHDQGAIVRIMAARFGNVASAEDARSRLRDRFDLGSSDVSVAPLGGTDHPAGCVSLAGRFLDPRVDEVRGILEGAGGEIIADLDEGWTRPRANRDAKATRWGSFDWRSQTGQRAS